MKNYAINKAEQGGDSNVSGMKRRDFLKWLGLLSATLLVSVAPAPLDAESAAKTEEPKQEATYYVSGWCIPH
ncbi:MAG: hypothetical protein WCX65_09235 [bacterium]